VHGVLRETGMQPHRLALTKWTQLSANNAAILSTSTCWNLMLLNKRETAASATGRASQRDRSR
jgi:hypothetical protein